MDNILANRRKVIEEDLIEAEKFRDAARELKESIASELETAKLKATEMIQKNKDTAKSNFEKGMEEASEMTEKLLSESEKKILKMQKEADLQVEKITKALVPEIVKKVVKILLSF